MATTPTNNPVPSNDLNDFRFNCEKVDEIVNSDSEKYTDRLGVERYTIDGVRKNLIPLGKQYMTLSDAQADIANIPVNSYTYVRDASGAALASEYQNVAGVLTATGRKMPSYDSIRRSNILFDTFNEQSSAQLTFANWDWYKGATPTFSTTDVNLPLPTPVIQASGVTSFDKYYDVSKLQVKPGDNLAFSVLVWFENAGGKLQIYWLDSAGTTISTALKVAVVSEDETLQISALCAAAYVGVHVPVLVRTICPRTLPLYCPKPASDGYPKPI
jgi:hypothetical protein